MARHFGGTTNKLDSGSGAVSGYPFTISCWGNVDNNADGASHGIFGIFGTGGAGDQGVYINQQSGSTSIQLQATDNNNWSAVSTGGVIVSGQWFSAVGICTSAVSRTLRAGGNSFTDVNSRSPTFTDTVIGAYISAAGATADNSGHSVAECAVWNVALTIAEADALNAGVSPLKIRPASLVFYAPVWGVGGEPFFRASGGGSLTVSGTTRSNDPPVKLRSRRASPYTALPIIANIGGQQVTTGEGSVTPSIKEALFGEQIGIGQGSLVLSGQVIPPPFILPIKGQSLETLQGQLWIDTGPPPQLWSLVNRSG